MRSFGTIGPRREVKTFLAPFQGNTTLKPPFGTINVIFAAPGRTGSCPSRVMSVSCYSDDESNSMPKRIKTNIPLVLSFSDANKQGTI